MPRFRSLCQGFFMGFGDYLLFRLAQRWPSPMDRQRSEFQAEPGSDTFEMAYARKQFSRRVRTGLAVEPMGWDALEIGCGHGGISCFLAVSGARRVVGIDINEQNLDYGYRLKREIEARLGPACELPLEFRVMNAMALGFPEGSFDLVVAENAFEHYSEPQVVMEQAYKVLRPGGRLLVPIFSSIYSKYGLHLKNGLKLPWANLIFSESTIIAAMKRLAEQNPTLYELYPGLSDSPVRVRDLRLYKDLNDITYKAFKRMARTVGFELEWFRPVATRLGQLLKPVPMLNKSILADVFSIGAAACLRKRS